MRSTSLCDASYLPHSSSAKDGVVRKKCSGPRKSLAGADWPTHGRHDHGRSRSAPARHPRDHRALRYERLVDALGTGPIHTAYERAALARIVAWASADDCAVLTRLVRKAQRDAFQLSRLNAQADPKGGRAVARSEEAAPARFPAEGVAGAGFGCLSDICFLARSPPPGREAQSGRAGHHLVPAQQRPTRKEQESDRRGCANREPRTGMRQLSRAGVR